MKQSLVVPARSNDTASLQKGKKNWKQFFVVTALSVAIILAAWGIFKPIPSSTLVTRSNNATLPVKIKASGKSGSVQIGGLAVPVTGTNFKVAPVFDTTGKIISDPSGTVLSASGLAVAPEPMIDANFKVAPVFNSAGQIISDPDGTVLGASGSEAANEPVVGADFKVAPVFNTTGQIISDPTGTVLSVVKR
jgi:hypothetical protein